MKNLKKIIIGIRNSKLSKVQTNLFIEEFINHNKEIDKSLFIINTIQTAGDINKSHRLDRIGGKGLFVKEIEDQIINGNINLGVHSLKDLPTSESDNNLSIVCWMKREDPHDVLISNSGKGINELPPGSIIGTSSIRRRSQVLAIRKDLSIKLLRGNVDTRIEKLRNNEYDAIILSLAGLKRLNLDHLVTEILEFRYFLPAACQGALGIQAISTSDYEDLFSIINHKETKIECSAERQVLKSIHANCNSPISVFSKIKKDKIEIKCELFNHNGEKIFYKTISGDCSNYLELSSGLGNDILKELGQEKINQLDILQDDFNYKT